MEKEIKNCVNTIKCIGAISELNLEFHPKQDNIIIRGAVVLLVNEEYIRFNIFASKKMEEQYYRIIETFGIPYSFISNIDNDEYTLDIEPITIGMVGSVKIIDNKKIVKQVDFNRAKIPTKLFIISNISQYGNQSTYIARSNGKCGISANIQGVIYKLSNEYITIIIPDANMDIRIVKFRYEKTIKDKIKSIPIGSMCNLKLTCDKGYDINNNIISNVVENGFKLMDIRGLDYIYDKDIIRNMIKIYEIKNKKRG